METDNEQAIKNQVQSFYNQVGWREVSEGIYQNARFEDLRPVSQEYIHHCHLRAGSFLASTGHLLLDAGSGPIQYPEYLTYSAGYERRVCLDISHVAIQEARQRIGQHGLYVVADVSALPFPEGTFGGVISLHTLHHLPAGNQKDGYLELWRVLSSGKNAVIVNGWTEAPLMRCAEPLLRLMDRLRTRMRGGTGLKQSMPATSPAPEEGAVLTGTYVQKFTPERLREILGDHIPYEIRCWRSISVRLMRTAIHSKLGGRLLLRVLFFLESHFSYFFGVAGQYPLIILKKPG